jgi:iron complex transport system ATP-binding protein
VRLGTREVLRGVDFSAPGAELTAIVGPNGAGKTSLLRTLAGLLPYSGSVTCEGEELTGSSARERARRLAYVPQRSRLTARVVAREVVLQGRYAQRPGWFGVGSDDRASCARALERVGAAHLAERLYPELSGGEQRLVLLARAIATGARNILLDEPTASLDLKHCLVLFELLESLARDGYCVVCVLHDLDDVQRHADGSVLLAEGRARASGRFSDPAFRRAIESTYEVQLQEATRLGFAKVK